MTRPLRILFLSHSPNNPNGGASRIYHMLAGALEKRGHAVSLFHQEDFGLPKNAKLSLAAQRFAMPRYVSAHGRRLDWKSYDIIMSSSGMAAPLFKRIKGEKQRPALVNHLHGLCIYDDLANRSEAMIGNWKTSLLNRMFTGPIQVRWDNEGIASGDLTIVQNQRDLSWIKSRLPSNASVRMISAAVHPELLDASRDYSPPQSRPPANILWFASWESRKGSFYVPAAFRHLREFVPDAKLTLGGTGMSQAALASQFDPQDRDNIEVLPRISIEEQIALFNRSSIFLFPSLSEGFGLALVEAMCFGLAAVTTNTAFGGDELVDGESARIVFPSSEHVARALIDLATSSERRAKIAQAGREIATTFTLDRMADAYEQAFQKLRHDR
jgi:glycosyltransferase involved in cell wall biosynthesis